MTSIELIRSLTDDLRNPKNVNTFYMLYWANHVGGIYETVDEAIKAWHEDDKLQNARK